MIIFAQLAAAARRTRVIAVAAMLLVTLATGAGSAFAAATAGPVDPATQFPAWYQDANGLQLALCLAGPPNCLVAAADFTPPDGEAFYWNAQSTLDLPTGGSANLVLAAEAAFVGGPITFGRVRFFASGLTPNSDYTVTYPYGVLHFTSDAAGAVLRNAGTTDVACAAPGCNFATALGSPVFGGFLAWDPTGAPPPPRFLRRPPPPP